MENKLLKKYQLKQKDWNNIDLVEMKIKAESVVLLFRAIENTLCSHVSPHEIELLDNTRDEILKYLDDVFINKKRK